MSLHLNDWICEISDPKEYDGSVSIFSSFLSYSDNSLIPATVPKSSKDILLVRPKMVKFVLLLKSY